MTKKSAADRKLPINGNPHTYDYRGICPFCNVFAHYQKIKPGSNILGYETPKLLDLNEITLGDNKTIVNLLFFDSNKYIKKTGVSIRYVISTFPLASVGNKPDGVPQKIWDDYAEGITCISANAPKGAVVIFRRASQSLAKELGAPSKKRLFEQCITIPGSNQIITMAL
ncbi:MAG: hypothetical protein ACXAEU_26235 [Candidatus Hodarchaeales archaeon]